MRCWLVKNNVPYDTAFTMGYALLWAHFIAFGEFERSEKEGWNYKSWTWNKAAST